MRAPRSHRYSGYLSRASAYARWQMVWACAWCFSLLLTACDSATEHPTSTPTHSVAVTSTPIGGLPSFSDWRVVYADGNGRIHAISTDGKNDVAGPMLVGLAPYILDTHDLIHRTLSGLRRARSESASSILLGQQAPLPIGDSILLSCQWLCLVADGTELAVDGGGDEKGIIHMPDLYDTAHPSHRKEQLAAH